MPIPLLAIKPAFEVVKGLLSKGKDLFNRFFNKDKIVATASSFNISPSVILMVCLSAFLLFILVPNFDNISEKLGFDTKRSLSVKLQDQRHNTDMAVDANNTLSQTIEVLVKTDEVKHEVVEELKENQSDVSKVTATRLKDKDFKIAEIVKTPPKPNVDKVRQISEVQIDAIWASYCDGNEDLSCKKVA